MEAKVTWKGRMSFDGLAETGFTLPLGASPSVGGDEDGFRPMELFAIGLAGCTAMDVISIMQKKRQDVTSFEVQVHVDQAQDYPKVFTRAVVEYIATGHHLDVVSLVRAIELSAVHYCPAQAMFNQIMPIELHYKLYEDLGGGRRLLVTGGVFDPQVGEIDGETQAK
jgi:putative redox protein